MAGTTQKVTLHRSYFEIAVTDDQQCHDLLSTGGEQNFPKDLFQI